MKFPAFDPINFHHKDFDVIEIEIIKIIPDQNQPRKIFDEAALSDLTTSIQQHGVIQPIVLRKIDHQETYLLIAGERRWRAAKAAGLKTVPAIIKDYEKLDRLAISLIENIQRENLHPLEEAQAIQNLLEECAMTHEQVAHSIGRSRVMVSNLLRLLNLADEVKTLMYAGHLDMGHARALLSLDMTQQIEVANIAVKNKFTVRQIESLIKKLTIPKNLNQNRKQITEEFTNDFIDWEKKLAQQLSTKIHIHSNSPGKGRVSIYFDSLKEFQHLMRYLLDKKN